MLMPGSFLILFVFVGKSNLQYCNFPSWVKEVMPKIEDDNIKMPFDLSPITPGQVKGFLEVAGAYEYNYNNGFFWMKIIIIMDVF